jgi:undecaprenyl pyrophosphate phosphatase UppP
VLSYVLAGTPLPTPRDNLKGIAGWLVLPIFGTILAVFWTAYGAFLNITALSSSKADQSVTNFVWLETLVTIGLLVAWIIACVQAFQHKRAYPKLFVSLTAVTLFLSGVDFYIAATVFNVPFESNDAKDIMRVLLTLLIWGPYMFLSKRVRNTFTR